MQYVQLTYMTKRGAGVLRQLPYDSATLDPIMARLRTPAILKINGEKIGGVEWEETKHIWVWWYETP
jgi:hypothetical protein